MKISKLILLSILPAILVVGSILILSFFPEARSMLLFKFYPAYARNVNFIRLAKDNNEIYLLGTIHGNHLTTRDYSLLHIKAVIVNLKPDLLLVESRPAELKNDNWADGPIEMPFASLTAIKLGVEVDGMDWFDPAKLGSFIKDNAQRDNLMAKNILVRVSGHKKVLVLSGYSHIPEFVTRLEKHVYKEMSFRGKEKSLLFNTVKIKPTMPPKLIFYLRKRIDIEQTTMQKRANAKEKRAYEKVINAREDFIKDIERNATAVLQGKE